MKIMKRTLFFLFLVTLLFQAQAQQIQPLKQNIDFQITPLGNALITVTVHLNALQWNNFKKAVGDNVSILKRSMERALPAYFLNNFKYTEDGMNQTYTLKFDAFGVCKVDQQGRWVAEMDSKNPDVTKITNNLYLLNSTMNANGVLIEQNIKVSFPKSAHDITIRKDAFGKAYFSYLQPDPSHGFRIWLYLGILFILAGLGWGYQNYKRA